MTHPQVGGDTGEQGTSPRDADDAWQVGAGIEPDDAAEGEAAVQAARDTGRATRGAHGEHPHEVPEGITDDDLARLDEHAAP